MEQIAAMFCLLLATALAQNSNLLETVYEWKQMDYVFPNSSVRVNMTRQGSYIRKNVVPFGLGVWFQGANIKIFVAVPDFKPGIPASLNTVVNDTGKPLLKPYPNWAWNQGAGCAGIISVFRVEIDPCDRLWVLDSGLTNIMGDSNRTCPPKVLVFNLKNDELLLRYTFPDSVLVDNSILTTIVVQAFDVNNGCQETFAYVADVGGFGIIVINAFRNTSWRVTSNFMYPYPLWGHFNLNGVQFDLMDGVLALALSPSINGNQHSILFFHSLASARESWVPTDVLRNSSLFENGSNLAPQCFHVSKGLRAGQASPEATSSSGKLFFSVLPTNTLNCWNPRLPYNFWNIVQLIKDSVRLQFVSGFKIVMDPQKKEWIWMLSNRYQNLAVNQIPTNEVNYRILKVPLEQVVRGTSCA